ncbi:MAG: TlpA disulfide reductase family protein [Candidatus Omnitrophota bacterium]
MQRISKWFSVLSVALFSLAIMSFAAEKEIPKEPEVGKAAPLFSARTLEKKLVKLEKLQGKLVLLDFWATWCPPCRGEIPHLQKAYEKYHKKGFEILSISLDKKAEDLPKFFEKNKMPWLHVFDATRNLSELYFIEFIPSSFLIDPKGKIVEMGDALRGEDLFAAIDKYIKDVPPPKEEPQEKPTEEAKEKPAEKA